MVCRHQAQKAALRACNLPAPRMADTDEELVRKIHLEINGLTRPRRARAALEVSGTEHSHTGSLLVCSA